MLGLLFGFLGPSVRTPGRARTKMVGPIGDPYFVYSYSAATAVACVL